MNVALDYNNFWPCVTLCTRMWTWGRWGKVIVHALVAAVASEIDKRCRWALRAHCLRFVRAQQLVVELIAQLLHSIT